MENLFTQTQRFLCFIGNILCFENMKFAPFTTFFLISTRWVFKLSLWDTTAHIVSQNHFRLLLLLILILYFDTFML